MIDAIMLFAEDTFADEVVDNIRKSFSLFEAYDYQDAYQGMYEIATDESSTTIDSRMSLFIIELCSQLDFIVKQHLILVDDDTTLKQRLVLLDALYRLQHLESYAAIDAILGSEQDPIDKMSLILEDLTEYDQGYFLTILKEVDRRSIFLLEKFVETKLSPEETKPVDKKLIERIKLFNHTLGKENIGCAMVEAGMAVGYPFDVYLPFISNDILDDSDEVTALNILSVLYITDTQYGQMVQVFREVADKLMPIDKVGNVEGYIFKFLSRLDDQQKVQNEQNRISQAGATN